MKAIIVNLAAAETEERALLESITAVEIEIEDLTARSKRPPNISSQDVPSQKPKALL